MSKRDEASRTGILMMVGGSLMFTQALDWKSVAAYQCF